MSEFAIVTTASLLARFEEDFLRLPLMPRPVNPVLLTMSFRTPDKTVLWILPLEGSSEKPALWITGDGYSLAIIGDDNATAVFSDVIGPR